MARGRAKVSQPKGKNMAKSVTLAKGGRFSKKAAGTGHPQPAPSPGMRPTMNPKYKTAYQTGNTKF